jgi:ABC-type polysaccharide/polyol phosphate transport system ATPase subunit
METAIDFKKVSKRYIKGASRTQLLSEYFACLLRTERKYNDDSEVWAIKDFSIKVEKGGTFGIMGPNGAGKSTLLKLLSGITNPTTGNIMIEGKVAALIEIGAGFHPELTGRENVYLNGSILGLKKREIDIKMNEIVEFAELEDFIDVPVKRYSSGMYVRLGFSVAINIDPDILLVDEVLAVGDLAFQHKCMKKINEFSNMGKTIILVSHNVRNIQMMCSKAIFLHKGVIRDFGDSNKVVSNYINFMMSLAKSKKSKNVIRAANGKGKEVNISQVRLLNSKGVDTNVFSPKEPLHIRITTQSNYHLTHPDFGITVWAEDEKKITTLNTKFDAFLSNGFKGKNELECIIHDLPFLPGTYLLRVGIYDSFSGLPYDVWGWEGKIISFLVESSTDSQKIAPYSDLGIIELSHSWKQL